MLGRLAGKIRKSVVQRGMWGTCRRLWDRVAARLYALTPAQRRERRRKAEKDQAFDARLGSDTGGIIHLNRLDITSANRDLGVSYWACDPDTFRTVLQLAALRHEEFTFIDFGSGKGRALLMAAEYPFRRIIGVEFAADLHAVAENNISRLRAARPQCPPIELVCIDAVQFVIPADPVVLFFYNPFSGAVMEAMVRRVQDSYEAKPRPMCVLYLNPRLDELWKQAPDLERVAGTGDYAIYKTCSKG